MNTTESPACERLRPVAEFRVDRDAQHRGRKREGIAGGELGVQLARRARAGHESFVAASGLLAQQREILHANRAFGGLTSGTT